MSEDVVAWLRAEKRRRDEITRDICEPWGVDPSNDLASTLPFAAAADEIERLRAEVERLTRERDEARHWAEIERDAAHKAWCAVYRYDAENSSKILLPWEPDGGELGAVPDGAASETVRRADGSPPARVETVEAAHAALERRVELLEQRIEVLERYCEHLRAYFLAPYPGCVPWTFAEFSARQEAKQRAAGGCQAGRGAARPGPEAGAP